MWQDWPSMHLCSHYISKIVQFRATSLAKYDDVYGRTWSNPRSFWVETFAQVQEHKLTKSTKTRQLYLFTKTRSQFCTRHRQDLVPQLKAFYSRDSHSTPNLSLFILNDFNHSSFHLQIPTFTTCLCQHAASWHIAQSLFICSHNNSEFAFEVPSSMRQISHRTFCPTPYKTHPCLWNLSTGYKSLQAPPSVFIFQRD